MRTHLRTSHALVIPLRSNDNLRPILCVWVFFYTSGQCVEMGDSYGDSRFGSRLMNYENTLYAYLNVY